MSFYHRPGRITPPPEAADMTDADSILAEHTDPEPAGTRRYVVRHPGGGLTHASILRLEDAQAEARQWGRGAVVCELVEVTP